MAIGIDFHYSVIRKGVWSLTNGENDMLLPLSSLVKICSEDAEKKSKMPQLIRGHAAHIC